MSVPSPVRVEGSAVRVEGLELHLGRRRVLAGLDLEVPAGSVTALVGRNGAGKSSLLRVLAGELRPRHGRVRVLGLDPWRARVPLRQRVGWVADRSELPPWMRVRDHLRLVAPFHPSWDADEARDLLERFGLDPRARYRDLSRGERVLENLAVALAARPELLLLDEPFSGLDVEARRDVVRGLLESFCDSGRTVLLVSHSLTDVERCADRLALLGSGRILVEGSLDDLLADASRIHVVLRTDRAQGWEPPGRALVESSQAAERVLFYPRLTDEDRQALATDPAVDRVEELGRDLEDLLAMSSTRRRS